MKGKIVRNQSLLRKAIVTSLGLTTLASTGSAIAASKDNNAVAAYLDTRIVNSERVEKHQMLVKAQELRAQQIRAEQGGGDDEEFPSGTTDWVNPEELLKQLEIKDSITAETTDLLGEQINLDTGTLSFSQTDVSLPGNFDLPVEIKRSYKGAQSMFSSELEFGDWEMQVPMITTELMGGTYGGYSGPWGEGLACSGTHTDNWTGYDDANFMPYEYWNGDILNIPGKINERLLHNNGQLANVDNNQFRRVTKSGWRVSCINNASEYGQHFEVHGPDGTIYTLDVVRLAAQNQMKKNTRYKAYMMASKVEDRFGNTVNYNYDARGRLTSIVASDGRTITLEYNYDTGAGSPVYRNAVSDVYANGRRWQYKYDADGAWNENYGLDEVIRPDGKKWEYSLWQLSLLKPRSVLDHNDAKDICKTYDDTRTISAYVKHPNGTSGTFTLEETLHGRANTDQERSGGTVPRDYINRCFYSFSVKQKTLSVPNQTNNYVWNYSYDGGAGYYGFDLDNQVVLPKPTPPSNAPIVVAFNQPYLSSYGLDPIMYRRTTVNAPDGSKTVYYHNRDYKSVIDGRLVVTEVYDGSTLVQSTVDEYETNQTNNPSIGWTYVAFDNSWPHTTRDRKLKSTIYQFKDGNHSTYETSYSDFNDYNVPRLETEYQSGIGKYRYTKKTFNHYFDSTYTGYWLLNIPSTTEVGSSESSYTTTSQINYHGTSIGRHLVWQPKEHYSFGKLSKTHTEYHTDGNLKKVEFNDYLRNASGIASSTKQYVKYENYKRGKVGLTTVPKRYSTSATKSMTRTIDNNGWVSQTIDFGNNYTSYTYDDLGRLESIRPHNTAILGTGITWDSTGRVQTTERCTVSQGVCTAGTEVLRTVKTFDGMFRDLNSITTDIASGIAIKQVKEHNAYNKVTFESKPFNVNEPAKAIAGQRTFYDAIMRPTTKQEIDENGAVYTTTSEYLLGNQVKTTDARNYETTTTYLAYGKPEQKQATLIVSPENVTTAIDVDVLGNIKSITQSGKHNSADISITETRAYDSNNRLCRVHRPDVGQTTYRYYDNGQKHWEATENAPTLTGALGCGTASAISSSIKKTYLYDNNGKEHEVSFGDGTSTVEYTYDINGDLETLKAGDILQNYVYNDLRQLTSESLHILNESKSWTFGYTYDSLGTKETMTYPDSDIGTVNFAPNAFGKPTQVVGPNGVNYATNATYYANNMLDTFTYGNGVVHKTTLNARGLPEQIHDYKAQSDKVKLDYTYDSSNNITSITDGVDNNYSLFTLTYDGLDRLTGTTGGSHIGGSSISYDSLGNILSYSSRNNSLTYTYDINKNRLQSVADSYNQYSYNFASGYDARGNVTNNGSRGFSYNLANHMTDSTANAANSPTFSYIYDGHNRRVISNDSKGKSYSFYSKEGKLIYRESDMGRTSYIHLGKKLIAKDGYVSQISDSRMHYKPFGSSIETPKDDIGYTGHKHDTDLALTYMQQRYYDPVIGRFMGNDPVGYTDENPVMSFNRYLYVNNNPYKFTDPNGEFFALAGAVVGAGIGAVGGTLGGIMGGLVNIAITGNIDPNMMAKSIISGAAIGALGGFVTGGMAAGVVTGDVLGASIVGAVATGAAGAGLMTLLDDGLPSKDLEKENLKKTNEELKKKVDSLEKELEAIKDQNTETKT